MCGITGIISKERLERSDITAMAAALAHRGPDATEIFMTEDGSTAFGHTRLSVIDLSEKANQPMTSPDGRYTIVFNGEIYNYRDLKARLLKTVPDCAFLTYSDTEVILQGFIYWGADICRMLEGMFAFAIYDHMRREVFLCRDRVGKKPLYFSCQKTLFAFASEIKSLLSHPAIRSNSPVDYGSIFIFLHLGYIPEPRTSYKTIEKFPAGCFAFVSHSGEMRLSRYSHVTEALSERIVGGKDHTVAGLKSVLHTSVKKRLISDVPLGAFLSGGTDSSLVTAMAAELVPGSRLKTFTIGFSDSPYDETGYANQVAEILKTDHHEYRLSGDEAVGLLEDYLKHFDEPFADTSSIPTMLISRLAKEHVTVALTGDGGDELFSGYNAYEWASRLDRPWAAPFKAPLSYALKRWGNSRLKRIGYLIEPVAGAEVRTHIFSQDQYFFSRSEIRAMASRSPDDLNSLNYEDPKFTWLNAAEFQALFDVTHYLKDDLLVKVDRSSMYYGLECRCPFLDPEVIDIALTLPWKMKKRSGEAKWILKEILKGYLPEKLVYRRKWGFSIPLVRWMKGDLAYLLDAFLNKSVVAEAGIVNYSHVDRLKKSFSQGDDFLYNRLWVLIVAHKWLLENAR